MCAHDLATETQTNPRAILLGGEERDEDLVEGLLDDTGSIVGDFQNDFPPRQLGIQIDPRSGFPRGGLADIAQQIE